MGRLNGSILVFDNDLAVTCRDWWVVARSREVLYIVLARKQAKM